MEIKQLREDKYEVVLHIDDLEKFNIDFIEFMSSKIEDLELFSIMLNYLDKFCNFTLKNKKIIFETFFIDNSYFLIEFYIIGILSQDGSFISKAGNSISVADTPSLVFRFSCFDFLCDFFNYIVNIERKKFLLNFFKIFKYKNNYYIIIDNSIFLTKLYDFIFLQIAEFAEFVSCSEIFARRLTELGCFVNIMDFKSLN